MEKEIKQEIKKLIDVSQKKEQKQKDFMSDKKLLNTKTGEMKDMNYCLIKDYRIRYLDLIGKSIYFQNIMQEKYKDDFISLFITLTANTKYHKYKTVTNKKATIAEKKR